MASSDVNVDPLGETRLVADQPLQLGLAARSRACRRTSSAVRGRPDCVAREMDGAVQRDDGLAGAGGAGDARRAAVVALDPAARCSGWRKTVHFSHGESSARSQFLDVGHRRGSGAGRPDAANGSAGRDAAAAASRGRAAGGEFEQRLGGLAGRWSARSKQACPRWRGARRQPLRRHAVAEQFVVRACRRRGGLGASRFGVAGGVGSARSTGTTISSTRLADLDQLRGAGRRDAFRACGARPSRRPCRDGRRSRAAGCPSVLWTIRRMSLLTRTDQKFLSFALSSLWKLSPGAPGSSAGRRPSS